MSMSFFRSKRNSLITMFVFGIIILSFLFWGGQSAENASPSTFVKVNGEEISKNQFQRLLNQRRRTFSQYMGSQANLNDELEKMIENQVATSLVMRKLLVQEARKLGIKIGADEILAALNKETAFHDPKLKRFSPLIYQSVLENNELEPRSFEQDIADDIAADRLRGLIEQSISVSDSEITDFAKIQSAEFELKILSFDPESPVMKKIVATTEAQLRSYFESHKSDFTSSEKRTFKLATLDLNTLERSLRPNTFELKNYYETVVKKSEDTLLGKGMQAHALHILVSDTSSKGFTKAQGLLKNIKNEGDFRNLAKTHSEDYSNASEGGDLGYFGKTAMVKAFSDAIFTKAKLGQAYGPVKTEYGYHIVWLLDKTDEGLDYQNREKQIAYLYTKEKIANRTKETIDTVTQTLKSSEKELLAVLESQAFVISDTEPLDRKSKSSIPYLVLQEGMKAPKGEWQKPQEVGKIIYVLKVSEILPPSPLSFEEAKEQVTKRFESENIENHVKNLYAQLIAKRKTIADAEKSATSQQLLKSLKPFGAQLPEPLASSDVLTKAVQELSTSSPFSSPMMHDGKWVLLASESWKSLSAPSQEEFERAKKEALSRKRASFFESYSNRLVKAAKIPEDFKKRYNI